MTGTNQPIESSSETTMTGPTSTPRMDFLYQKIVGQIQYPQQAVCSYLATAHTLRNFRLFALMFLSVTAIISIVNHFRVAGDALDGLKYIIFFTNLNLYGLIAYFALTLVITQRALKSNTFSSTKPTVSQPVSILHALLYTCQSTFHPLVVLIYWVFLSKTFTGDRNAARRFVSIATHGITLVFVLADVTLSAMQINIWQIFPALVLMVLYALYALIYYAMSSVFVYDFLDFNKPQAAYMYPGTLVGVVMFFFIMLFVHKVKDRVFKAKPLIMPVPEPGNV